MKKRIIQRRPLRAGLQKKNVVRISKASAKPKTAVQEALEITWVLKGHLKNAQISYLRAGAMLAKVRDKKLYSALQHPDIESYAETRLNLGRASLYRYLQVYDWACKYHNEWLQPKPKGFIPELSDVADLVWIDKELERKDLPEKTRTELAALQKKGLEGNLRQNELSPYRKKTTKAKEGVKSFLSKLRALRTHGKELASIPSEVIARLDAIIELLENAGKLQIAGIMLDETAGSEAVGRKLA